MDELGERPGAEGRSEILLLAKLLREADGVAGAGTLRRVSRQLRLYADIPELASLALDGDAVDPALLRFAARALAPPPAA